MRGTEDGEISVPGRMGRGQTIDFIKEWPKGYVLFSAPSTSVIIGHTTWPEYFNDFSRLVIIRLVKYVRSPRSLTTSGAFSARTLPCIPAPLLDSKRVHYCRYPYKFLLLRISTHSPVRGKPNRKPGALKADKACVCRTDLRYLTSED